jgi:putative RNA 2'-phosphotransferase
MTDKEMVRTSKLLSLILRHEPERFGLKLDEAGRVDVGELLDAQTAAARDSRARNSTILSGRRRFQF